MDVDTVDNEFLQLQGETQETVQTIQTLATKLQAAAGAGGSDAKEWLLDLKGIALQVQQEQLQVQALLQAIHAYALNVTQQAQPFPRAPQVSAPLATFPSQRAQPGSGMSRFFGGNFGQAIESGAGMGVGFGLTNAIVGSIFGR